MSSETKIALARAAADWLDANGQPQHAHAVRSVCRSNSALIETCSRLSSDNRKLIGKEK